MKAWIIAALLAAAVPAAAVAQQEKAEIQILNGRAEPIVMRFSYAFRQYTWKLMEQSIPVGEDLTYRFPSNIPGCEQLHAWGIADGVLSITNAAGLLCEQRVSLCDRITSSMAVGDKQCRWRQVGGGPG